MAYKFFTEEEDMLIIQNYPTMKKDVCKLFPDRSVPSVMSRINKLGFNLEKEKVDWSEKEEQILKTHYPIMGANKVQKLLPNRSVGAIINHAYKMGLKNPRSWNKDEDLIIREHDFQYTDELLKLLPDRSKSAIKLRIKYLFEKYCKEINYPMNVYIEICGTYKGYDKVCDSFAQQLEKVYEVIKKNSNNPEMAIKIITAIDLRYKQHMDFEEVANKMHIKVEHAKWFVDRGISVLKKALLKNQ